VALGWLFYREPFGAREAIAMIVIFAGVGIVKRYSQRGAQLNRVLPSSRRARRQPC
jgi:drug/metabolite transporter (DMT)-like permease